MNDKYNILPYKIDNNTIAVNCTIRGVRYGAMAVFPYGADLERVVFDITTKLLEVIPYNTVDVVDLTIEVYSALSKAYERSEIKTW